MSQTVLKLQGCFEADLEAQVNNNFTELYASEAADAAAIAALQTTAGQVKGSSNDYIKTDTGTKTLLAAAAVDRTVLITVNVTTVFANGDGAQPTLALGQTGSTSKFAATSAFTGAAAGTTKTFGGTLTAGTALLATQTTGTGTTETGAYTVTAIAVP